MHRLTLQITKSSPAPIRIIGYILPLWLAGWALMLFMPTTGLLSTLLASLALLVLPFKARSGFCPNCSRQKIFPCSGFGSSCKRCGQELVLRGVKIHLLEKKHGVAKLGSGRGQRLLSRENRCDAVPKTKN